MTAIPVSPFVLKDVLLTVGADDYAAHVDTFTLVPTRQSVTWQGLSPDAKFTDQTAPTWAAQLQWAQDWTTTDSLARYALANEGQTKTVKFQPKKGTGLPSFTVDCIIAAGQIGGQGQQVQTASVTWGIDGAPVPDYDDDPGTPNPEDA